MHTIKGTIKYLMDEQSGTSKAGRDWYSREFVLECNEEGFINQIPLKAFGVNAHQLDTAKVGDKITVDFRLGGREYNGRWYLDVNVRDIRPEYTAPAEAKKEPEEVENDLPF